MGESQDPVVLEKARLRAEFRRRRDAMGVEARALASRAIGHHLLALPEADHATTVHVYWPLDARAEVDTRPVIDLLLTRGVRIALPVVVGQREGRPHLEQRQYAPGALGSGAFGALEPLDTPAVGPEEIDLAIVPALAASRDGFRLGYGGGYYDAFLVALDATVVCPVFDECLVDTLPIEPHDHPIDVIVTESGVLRPSRRP